LYLVTANHVVTGVSDANAVIQVNHLGQWQNLQTIKTLHPRSKDADIAVFSLDESASQSFAVKPMEGASGATFGQTVWFLGYPFGGLGSQFNNGGSIPFIKRGTMSAIDGRNPDAVVLYVDGFNNPGFSGGPIIFWNFSSHTYEIAGVVKGYRTDTAKVRINEQTEADTNLLVNSGILVGYSIKHALEAIDTDRQ
jgi:hypothetical protein